MKLGEILIVMQNKIALLNEARKTAVATGDLLKVTQIDDEILTTSISINALQNVLTLE